MGLYYCTYIICSNKNKDVTELSITSHTTRSSRYREDNT